MVKCSECESDARDSWEGKPVCHRCLLFHLIRQDAFNGDNESTQLLELARKFFTSEEQQKDFVACFVEVAETAVRAEKQVILLDEANKVARKWKLGGPMILEAAMSLGYAVSSKLQP